MADEREIDPDAAAPSWVDDPEAYHRLAGFEGDWRDLWWNRDFLELMARRWRLAEVRSMCDVGCGVGHWGQALAQFVSADAALYGVDREAAFCDQARERAEQRGLGGRFDYRCATAEALPFDGGSLAMVTCQTVLMHVADVPAAIAEAIRVLEPGGLLAVAEPGKLASSLSMMSGAPRIAYDDLFALLRLEQICHAGKRALGQGDSTIGDLLPGMFGEAGLVDVRVVQNDRCAALFPPYDAADQQLDVERQLDWLDQAVWLCGTRDDVARLYRAGGGDPAQLDDLWARAERVQHQLAADIRAGTYHGARGFIQYLVSGRKPA